jgi:hypothetical protein
VNPAAVDAVIALAVGRALDEGYTPCRVLLGIPAYQALVARDGLATRHIGRHLEDTLRAAVLGLDLCVDVNVAIPSDDARVTFVRGPRGLA